MKLTQQYPLYRSIYSVFMLILIFQIYSPSTIAQDFEENFNYTSGQDLTSNGWTDISGGATPTITVHSSGLSYTDYASVGGNAASMSGSGEDVSRSFSGQSSGTVYCSFLLNVSDAPTGAVASSHRIFALSESSSSTEAEVFATEATGTTYQLSVRKNEFGFATTTATYSYGTTYLVVLKYAFDAGSNPNPILNDEVSIYVFTDPSLPSTEPGSAAAGPIGDGIAIDASDLDNITLWQENASQSHIIDGIRIGTIWGDAPLPVSLSAFYALARPGEVTINWRTESELNNDVFILERGFTPDNLVPIKEFTGQGTTNIPTDYSYTDASLVNGATYYYRLVDRDYSGNLVYHSIISATPGEETAQSFELLSNYPNPFNPETNIRFEVSTPAGFPAQIVDLSVFNSIGQKVRSLFNGELTSGIYTFTWDGKNDLGTDQVSGVYFLNLISGKEAQTTRMILIR